MRMFNTGDVYAAMAQHFYQAELPTSAQQLSGRAFKRKHPHLREQMKSCTLGIMYGMTPQGIALSLNTTLVKATALQQRFLGLFPHLTQAMSETVTFGGLCGYTATVSGLRGHRAKKGALLPWERNWLANHPVQGSAAVVFKSAGNRLDRLYRQYNARLLIPLHDAFIFEAPLEVLEKVAQLTKRVMCETVQEYFPELRPRVEINIKHLHCWNKEGDAAALTRWVRNPLSASRKGR